MKGRAHPSPFADLSFPNSKKVPIYCWVDRVFQSPHGEAEPRTHAIRRLSALKLSCSNHVSNPGPLTYETGALLTALCSPGSYQSVISEYLLPLIPCTGAVSRYFTLTKVIYKQKKLGYYQTVFTVSKVQSCILVSFVFKLLA